MIPCFFIYDIEEIRLRNPFGMSEMSQHEIIYGYHAVKMLLKTRPKDVLQLFVQASRQDHRANEIISLAQSASVNCQTILKVALEKMFGDDIRHQGIVAKCRLQVAWTEAFLIEYVKNATYPVVLLILDGVQDPHNLGACLRAANAFGVTAVIIPKNRAASKTEVVKKVASGAAEQTPLIAVANLNRTIKELQQAGVWFVGLDSEATLLLSQIDLKGNIGIVMGGEENGLRRLTRESCDYLAKIPMQGVVESLNVSVATGITLYEMQRQRST